MEIMRQRHGSQICAEQEEASMADCLLCIPNPADCSPTVKPRSPLKIEKKLDPEMSYGLKSQAKQAILHNPGKSGSHKRKTSRIDDLYNHVEAKAAEEVIQQGQDNQTSMEEEDEHLARSQFSPYIPNPVDSSPMISQKLPLIFNKRKQTAKKLKILRSKSKNVIVCNPRKSGRGKRTRIDDLYDSIETKFSVMERAEEVLINLAADCPSFFKCMLPSNVAHGFWLILPKNFCNVHLPRHDTTVILVDECGEEYKTNYLVERHGLSGGWRAFSLAHRLLKGDCLVFHLVESCKLKVNIVRVHGLDEIDAALCLMNLAASAKRKGSSAFKDVRTLKKTKKCVEPLLLDIPQVDIQKDCPVVLDSSILLSTFPSENGIDNLCSEVSEGPEIACYLQSNELVCC